MSDVRTIFFDLERRGAISRGSLVGCNEEEILGVEKSHGGRLPRAYRDFLMVAGRSAGKLFAGSAMFYPELLQLNAAAKALFSDSGFPDLYPHDAKAFCMHQGYEVLFFMPGADDPAIFQYVEGECAVTQPWNSFSEFLSDSIEKHLAHWPDLNPG
ncbi:SMI1/KNR4 family protein [Pseudomonas vanderleydeniana]|uniref:SMI1/KNR4 family protein n=1 Tax=Pseudomonas vanderleydeniana TaxID=2745495 RepID=A0A9E6PRG1_9PSED|nr:SMI1/KNR4 family protein [Pseudomonas vanderleydeniana]QXI31218.1 SMI1/KNR4 family protein [Pseudomonas vanderleydeniana]